MRIVIVLVGGLLVCLGANAQTVRKPTKDFYMKCVAIGHIGISHPKEEVRERFKPEFDVWVRYVAHFHPDGETLVAEIRKAGLAVQADLESGRLNSEGLGIIAEQCTTLMFQIGFEITDCIKEKGAADEQIRQCTRQALGIRE